MDDTSLNDFFDWFKYSNDNPTNDCATTVGPSSTRGVTMNSAAKNSSISIPLAPVAQITTPTRSIAIKSSLMLFESIGPALNSGSRSDPDSANPPSSKHQGVQPTFTTLQRAANWVANYQQNHRKNDSKLDDEIDHTIPVDDHQKLQFVSKLFAAFKTSIAEPIPAKLGNFTSEADLWHFVEYICWQTVELCITRQNGGPLTEINGFVGKAKRKGDAEFESFADRMDAIVGCIKSTWQFQKMLHPSFLERAVDDPFGEQDTCDSQKEVNNARAQAKVARDKELEDFKVKNGTLTTIPKKSGRAPSTRTSSRRLPKTPMPAFDNKGLPHAPPRKRARYDQSTLHFSTPGSTATDSDEYLHTPSPMSPSFDLDIGLASRANSQALGSMVPYAYEELVHQNPFLAQQDSGYNSQSSVFPGPNACPLQHASSQGTERQNSGPSFKAVNDFASKQYVETSSAQQIGHDFGNFGFNPTTHIFDD